MKKCKECGKEETGYGSLLDEDGYCFTCGVKYSKEKINRLQEQLNEANKVLLPLKYTPSYTRGINLYDVHAYLEKWGVK